MYADKMKENEQVFTICIIVILVSGFYFINRGEEESIQIGEEAANRLYHFWRVSSGYVDEPVKIIRFSPTECQVPNDNPDCDNLKTISVDIVNEPSKLKEGDKIMFTKDYSPFKSGEHYTITKKQIGNNWYLIIKKVNEYYSKFDGMYGNPEFHWRNVDDKGFRDSVVII